MLDETRLNAFLSEQQWILNDEDRAEWQLKLEKLYKSCHPKQQAFAFDPGKRVCALVPRGGGKTTAVKARILHTAMTIPKAKIVYIATSRSQGEELLWGPLKDTAEKLDIQCKFGEQKLKMTLLKNGSTVRIVGADDKREIEKLRGQPFHLVCIDESASYPSELLSRLILRIIGPRLGDYDGALVLIGTPSHLLTGPFYDASRPGSDVARPYEDRDKPEYKDWIKWSTHKWTLKDGAPYVKEIANLWRNARLEKERQGWGDDHPVWRREYLGQWCADDSERMFKYTPHTEDGTEWNQWDPEKDKSGFAKLPAGNYEWRYVHGHDMGHSDPYALEIFAFGMHNRTLYHVYEFNKKGMYAKTIAETLIGPAAVKRVLDGDDHGELGGVMFKRGWPEAAVADTAGLGGAVLDELRNVYGISITPAKKKNKFDNIQLLNGDMIEGRVKIMKGSILEQQLLHLQWDTDDHGNLKEPKSERNDAADALVYARREAHYQFSGDAEPVGKRTLEQIAQEEEENEAGINTDEFEDYLSSGYEEFYY